MKRCNVELPDLSTRIRTGPLPQRPAGSLPDQQHGGIDSTWRSRKRRWIILSTLLLVFALGTVMLGPWAPEFVMPGELSTPHAQILKGMLTQDRCAACHQNVSTQSWADLQRTGHEGLSDAMLLSQFDDLSAACMECHHTVLPEAFARHAHNLSADIRGQLTELASNRKTGGVTFSSLTIPDTSIDQNDIGCSVCHQEHHGADFDLTAITDSRCQTCHQQQFGQFVESHPEFRYEDRPRFRSISFDHSKHRMEHFPKSTNDLGEAISFDCQSCHRSSSGLNTEGSGVMSTLPFEQACAACHDESLKVQIASAPALFGLPTITAEVAEQTPSWPVEATGFPDGELPLWMMALLQNQIAGQEIASIGNVTDLNWESPQIKTQLSNLAVEIRSLVIEFALHGQSGVRDRLLQAGASETSAERLARSISPQLLQAAALNWFANQSTSDLNAMTLDIDTRPSSKALLLDEPTGDGLLTDFGSSEGLLMAEDPLLTKPLSEQGDESESSWVETLSERFDPMKHQTLGGWYRDDLTFSIRYRGQGHQDPVLTTLIEIMATMPTDDPLRRRIAEHASVKACLRCHQGESESTTGQQFVWRVQRRNQMRDRFTKFDHRPHVNVRELQDCQHCHQLSDPENQVIDAVMAKPASTDNGQQLFLGKDVGDFKPLRKAMCVTCHTKVAAGESCTTCHRYHVGTLSPQSP